MRMGRVRGVAGLAFFSFAMSAFAEKAVVLTVT